MKPQTEFASKGFEVEEWADRHFFRPVGFRLTQALAPTPVTADQVTVMALVLGLVAGHLMFYRDTGLNLLGVMLFVISDIFDSADGQLARLRGVSTRAGRILDGVSDGLRFVNLYVNLVARLLVAGGGWDAVLLGLAALASHTYQSAAVDLVRNAYLWLGLGRKSELELPGAPRPAESRLGRIGEGLYAYHLRREALMFPHTVRVAETFAGALVPPAFTAGWRQRQTGTLSTASWIGQNIRFLLLLFTAAAGWPAGFFWITVGPLNVVLAMLILTHERNAATLMGPANEVVANA